MENRTKKEEPAVHRVSTQKEAIFSALNGIFQLPRGNREGEFLKAAQLMVEKGFGEICEEFVLSRMSAFGGQEGSRILDRVVQMIKEKDNSVRDSHEARTSEILLKGPGPVVVSGAPPKLKVVRSG